jgi:hypothetical protein
MNDERMKELSAVEAKNILEELYKKHEETGECGIYEITSDKQLGEKVEEL